MKKSLVALAALATVGAASAQSSVTLFGVVDAAISSYSNKAEDSRVPTWWELQNPAYAYVNRGTVTTRQTGMSNSGNASSRLGFRGTEDLGGGLAASFWLETQLGNDDGTAGAGFNNFTTGSNQFFNRRSTVSLSGAFGEVRLGRDYTPSFWNNSVFDPFGNLGVGANLINRAASSFEGMTAYSTRTNNSVGYFLPPNLGGFYGQLMYSFHEQAKYSPGEATPHADNNSRTGRYLGGRVGYANGPLDVAFAYASATTGDDYHAGLTENVNVWNLGASYNFGPVKLFGEYSNSKAKVSDDGLSTPLLASFGVGIPEPSVKGWLLGASVPVGPGEIKVSYAAVKYDLDEPASLLNPGAAFDPVFNPFLGTADPKANQLAIGYVHNLSKRTALYATVARISNKNGAALRVGGPGFFATPKDGFYAASDMMPKSSMGYDIGLRHSF